jgi:hypothetical protein
MDSQEIERKINILSEKAEERRKAAQDPCFRPYGTDWMSEDEIQELTELQTAWMLAQPTKEELQARVKAKREARRKEISY